MNTRGYPKTHYMDVWPDKVIDVVQYSQTNILMHTTGRTRMMSIIQSDHNSQNHYWSTGITLIEDNPEDNLQQFQLLSQLHQV